MTAKKKEHSFYECPNTHKADRVDEVLRTMGEHTVELQIVTTRIEAQMHALGDNVTTIAEQLITSYDRLDKRITKQEEKNIKTTSALMFLMFIGALLVTEFIKYLPKMLPGLFPFIK